MTRLHRPRRAQAFAFFMAAFLGASFAAAQPPALIVEEAWARATPDGATVGAGYARISNAGAEADRLTGAESPVAERVELHETADKDGVATMRRLTGGVAIAAGGTAVFKPGGAHLMFLGLKQELREGDTFAVTLVFDKAGRREATFLVAPLGAKTRGEGHKHH